MIAYTLDLRQRIIDAVEQNIYSKREIAEIFGIHESFIYKLLRQRRERGNIAPLPHGGGAQPKLTETHAQTLAGLSAAHPDATLAELSELLREKAGVEVSISTVCRGLQELGLPLKESPSFAAEADPKKRASFEETQATLKRDDLIFIDEFGIHTAMTRARARAPIGQRAEVVEPFQRGSHVSVISALGLQGVGASMMIEGAIDTPAFDAYVDHFLVPTLRPGNIGLLDNAKFHYSKSAIQSIEAAGAAVLYLPAYSPDFNPIEECISKIKETLRSLKARTQRKLYHALKKAMALVTGDDIRGWFEHCGYIYSCN